MKKLIAFLLCSLVSNWGASLDSQAQVALSMKNAGYFASSSCEPIFSPELLPKLSAILNGCRWRSRTKDDCDARSFQYDWHLYITKADAKLHMVLSTFTGMRTVPGPIEEVIAGFFRHIPDGSYRAQFVLSDDFGDWATDREKICHENEENIFTFKAAPLYWHQDRFLGLNRNYRYLGSGIIEQKGVSSHQIRLGLAKKASLWAKEKNSVLYSSQDVDSISSLDSLKGATFFVDQDWSKDEKVLVNQHTGYGTFITNMRPDISWTDAQGKWASYAQFFSHNFRDYLQHESNDVRSTYERPKRQKFILRVMEIDSGFDSDLSGEES